MHQLAVELMIDNRNFVPLKNNISLISLLGQHIISRANGLINFSDPNDQMLRRRKKDSGSNTDELMQRFRKVFHPGDLVLAMGDICEIVKCHKSKYGHTSCEVRFLTKPPLPETPTDWLPVEFIVMILPKRKVRQFLFKNKDKPNTPKILNETFTLWDI